MDDAGRILKAARLRKGLTAADVAEAVGYEESMWYKIESGKRHLEPALIGRACDALDVPRPELMAAMGMPPVAARPPWDDRLLVLREADMTESARESAARLAAEAEARPGDRLLAYAAMAEAAVLEERGRPWIVGIVGGRADMDMEAAVASYLGADAGSAAVGEAMGFLIALRVRMRAAGQSVQ